MMPSCLQVSTQLQQTLISSALSAAGRCRTIASRSFSSVSTTARAAFHRRSSSLATRRSVLGPGEKAVSVIAVFAVGGHWALKALAAKKGGEILRLNQLEPP
jgi:hypothetical protein